jgi:hypothetical protein
MMGNEGDWLVGLTGVLAAQGTSAKATLRIAPDKRLFEETHAR